MNCESIQLNLTLYLYGELPGEEEERVEAHLDACAACTGELAVRRAMLRAIGGETAPVPGSLLEQCRGGLSAALAKEAAPAQRRSWLHADFAEWMSAWFGNLRLPVGALALLAVGFLAARFTGRAPVEPELIPANSAELVSAVRSVETDPAGRVHIALDETRRRMVSGSLADAGIRKLLLAAVRDDSDPGVRVESMEMLKGQSASSQDVREALIGALMNDTHPGVRLKAIEGLKAAAFDAGARKAMLQALTSVDAGESGLRMQAIDILTAGNNRELVGVWQSLVEREQDPYVRMRCQKALQAMNASVGTF